MGKINGNIVQRRWAVLNPIDMDCTTWQAMWQSGARPGTSMTIIRVSPMDNPKGPETGNEKVSRGGHWYSWHKGLRVYNRGGNPPDVKWFQDVQGFRCALDVK